MNYMQMLARIGVGSAHPGGFAGTLELLEQFALPKESRILEVGCGTGRTACYLAKQGYDVTSVDVSEEMIAKAHQRAEADQVSVQFIKGDVCELPLPGNSFDIVLAESVSIFVDTRQAIREYYRVLQEGGKLYDREIIAMKSLDHQLNEIIEDFYGVHKLWNAGEWLTMLEDEGFVDAEAWKPQPFPDNMWEIEMQHPDPHQRIDLAVYNDPEIWKVAFQYDEIMSKYRDYFGYTVLIAQK